MTVTPDQLDKAMPYDDASAGRLSPMPRPSISSGVVTRPSATTPWPSTPSLGALRSSLAEAEAEVARLKAALSSAQTITFHGPHMSSLDFSYDETSGGLVIVRTSPGGSSPPFVSS